MKIVRSFLPSRLRPKTLTIIQTYSAQVTSVLPVLLSAIRVSPPSDGPPHDGKVIGKDLVTYTYNQPVAIPSYLIAIAAGDLRYRAFTKPAGKTWSSGIWTEPSLLDAAFWEFSEDTTRQVTHKTKYSSITIALGSSQPRRSWLETIALEHMTYWSFLQASLTEEW